MQGKKLQIAQLDRLDEPDRSNVAAVRKFQRSLSLAVREKIDPSWWVEWNLLILQGKPPILVKDARASGGYRVTVNEGASSPTQDDQYKAWKALNERGYGQPVQQLQLDAELKGQIASFQAELDLQQISGALPMNVRTQMLQLLGVGASSTQGVKELAAPAEPEDEELVEAEDRASGVIDVG